jgi:hypothetical protein
VWRGSGVGGGGDDHRSKVEMAETFLPSVAIKARRHLEVKGERLMEAALAAGCAVLISGWDARAKGREGNVGRTKVADRDKEASRAKANETE